MCIVIQGPSTGKVVRIMRAASQEEVRKSLTEHTGVPMLPMPGHFWRLDLPVAWPSVDGKWPTSYIAYEDDMWLLPITPDAEIKAQELKEKIQ